MTHHVKCFLLIIFGSVCCLGKALSVLKVNKKSTLPRLFFTSHSASKLDLVKLVKQLTVK